MAYWNSFHNIQALTNMSDNYDDGFGCKEKLNKKLFFVSFHLL